MPLLYGGAMQVILKMIKFFLSREADFLIRLRRDFISGTVRSVQS